MFFCRFISGAFKKNILVPNLIRDCNTRFTISAFSMNVHPIGPRFKLWNSFDFGHKYLCEILTKIDTISCGESSAWGIPKLSLKICERVLKSSKNKKIPEINYKT